ncbi:MAG: hypothetical protein WCN88_04530 [Candidatus Falkowbacteria bacterium]
MNFLEFIRQFRLGGYAIFDLAVSFLGIYLLSPLLSKLFLKIRIRIPKINWVFLTLPIGILTHLLSGKMTPMTKNFFDLQSNYLLKIIIISLLVFGLKGIKTVEKSVSSK